VDAGLKKKGAIAGSLIFGLLITIGRGLLK